jgi:hypothetical protein
MHCRTILRFSGEEKLVNCKGEASKQLDIVLCSKRTIKIFSDKGIYPTETVKGIFSITATLDISKLNKCLEEFNSIPKTGYRFTSGKSEFLLSKNYGHLNHAYCITSHASQGKPVDRVLISQPSSTFAALDMKQFYVSASRERESVTIYTGDKEGLFDHILNLKRRMLAMELLKFRSNAKMMNRVTSEFGEAASDLSFNQIALT